MQYYKKTGGQCFVINRIIEPNEMLKHFQTGTYPHLFGMMFGLT
jgi:hypothetical protein